MEQPSKPFAGLAEVLLAQGSAGEMGTHGVARAEHVYRALFEVSAPVLGAAGARALLARSVKLTKAQFPCLAEIAEGAASSDEGRPIEDVVFARLAELEPDVASKLVVVLLSNLLALMATFIGERLVWQLLKSAFPAMGETGLEERE